jgi:hypothetical protein
MAMVRGNYAAIAACMCKDGVSMLNDFQRQLAQMVTGSKPGDTTAKNRRQLADFIRGR